MTQSLANLTVWITGAGTGIGRAIARAFTDAGARLALTGRTRATLEETRSLLGHADAHLFPADVSDPAEVAAAHQAIVAALGPVDILVNNAGTNVPRRNWRQLSAADMAEIVNVNLEGPFLCSLAVLPAMRERRAGTLIHIVSNAATGIFAASGPTYTAAKTGARAMSATINAEEGIHGIRSVCINPGEVETPILDKRPHPPGADDRARMLQPEDVAAAALFAATLPARACVAELTLTPTDNAFYRRHAHAIAGTTP